MTSSTADGSSGAAHRVLWVTENYPPSRGGMAQSCDRIVRGLRAAGAEVDVAHLSRVPGPWRIAGGHGGRVLTCPLEDDPEHALRRLAPQLERDAPYSHVVAFGGTYPLLAAPVYAAWLAAPLLTLLRGNDFDAGVFSLRRRGALFDALTRAAAVGIVARSYERLVRSLVPNATVTYVANGIDLRDWEVLPSERARADRWRAEYVADDRRTIGLIGHLKAKKGVVFFLEALVASGHADRFHVVLVGELDPSVTQWLDGPGARLACTCLPFLDRFELLHLYPACDVIAVPSFYDGFPNVALEATALGIPLVTSDAGGLADLVEDGVNGLAFASGDASGCRAAISRLATTTPDELAALGEHARKITHADYTATAETARYLDLLRATSTKAPG